MRFNASFILISALAFAGCSGSSGKIPLVPSGPVLDQSSERTNRHLWGIWDVRISADRATVDIEPMRSAEMHLNAVHMLEVAPCSDCLTIKNVYCVYPYEIQADITVKHPYAKLLKYTAFDVRGIFITKGDVTFPASGRNIGLGIGVPRLLNPDGYTPLFNPTEFPSGKPAVFGYIPGKHAPGDDLSCTLNRFVAFRKDAPRRMFEPGGLETRTVRILTPEGLVHFGYAIDVCWQQVDKVVDPLADFPLSANCLEPYRMDISIGAGLLSKKGSQVPIQVEIYDHQGLETISTVIMEAPLLFDGLIPLSFSNITPNDAFLFTATLPNDLGAMDGQYLLLVRATDSGSDKNLGDVAAWQVARARVGAPRGWSRTWGGTSNEMGDSVAIDGSGNAYITGSFKGTVDFDPGAGVDSHSSNGDWDFFLSKFDPDGNFIWARAWGGPSGDWGNSVAVDGFGDVYVTGGFMDTADFDPGAGVDGHTSNGNDDVSLSKFDSNGNFIWARTWGGSSGDESASVATDSSGNAYVTGYFRNTVDFDPGAAVDNHTSIGWGDVFLSKFDPGGNIVWARTLGGSLDDRGHSVAIDGSGNAYVAGYFQDTVDFDPGPGEDNHTSHGAQDDFLSKFDPDGNYVWARTWGGLGLDEGLSVAIDGSANAYAMGVFDLSVDFDPGPGVDNHTSNDLEDIFLSKFDTNGNYVWARTWGGSGYDYGISVAVDGSGNAYSAGYFGGTADFDPGAGVDNRTSNGISDVFLSKLDPNGNFIWVRAWGGSDYDDGQSVAIDGSGNSYVTGRFKDTVDFDPGAGVENHTSNGAYDIFLSKFPADGNW